MKKAKRKIKIGILGCGAIGSRIARSISGELRDHCVLSGVFDIDFPKAANLSQELNLPNIFKKSYSALLKSCEFLVEAVNAANTHVLIRQAILARKHVLVMSVGKLLNHQSLFQLAGKNKSSLLIPSGAIAGIDCIKAAGLANISSITLTTRKPPAGLAVNPDGGETEIHLGEIKAETVVFEGDVARAVELFPKNINVAATIALACGVQDKMSVRIVTSPEYKTNSHEIEMIGDFGRMVTKTDNVVCSDNPKTSYLAVLSAIQTLKQFFLGVKIGT